MKVLILMMIFSLPALSQSTDVVVSGKTNTTRATVSFPNFRPTTTTTTTTTSSTSEVTTSTPTSIGYSAPTYNYPIESAPATSSTDSSIILNHNSAPSY